jgi:GNAT superfamily N-acetyltransferase
MTVTERALSADRPVVESIVLKDGSSVELMPMDPSDEPRLTRFHDGLSAGTIRRRFFYVHPKLTDAEVRRFTHVDHVDREAIVATSEGEIIAVARFDRIDGSTAAEAAFVVADRWQARGLGTVLLSRLVARARQVGITHLEAQTLAGNRPMLAVFRHAGLPITERSDERVVEVTLTLTDASQPSARGEQ